MFPSNLFASPVPGWTIYQHKPGGFHVDGGLWFFEPERWDRRRSTYSAGYFTYAEAVRACGAERYSLHQRALDLELSSRHRELAA